MSLPNDPLALPIRAKISSSINAFCDIVLPKYVKLLYTRYITTFSTHDGLWRYKRLNFGISSVSEVFQNVIANVIDGIEGALNMSDEYLFWQRSNGPISQGQTLEKSVAKTTRERTHN